MKVVHCVVNADLRLGHRGLRQQAVALGVKPQEMRNGEILVFLNATKTGMKILAGENLVAYAKSDTAMDLASIPAIIRKLTGESLPLRATKREPVEPQTVFRAADPRARVAVA